MLWRVQGLTFTVTGVENVPADGGAVIAINHTGYLDFTFAGLPAYRQKRGRKVRFMAKKEVFDNKITGPIMRSLRHIEVDRDSGAASFDEACRKLKEGELVGVYPEATISRSFEIKEFKSGAARMAIAADVPIVPHIVWGAQRIWTKGHPKNMRRPKVPISVAVGEPIYPTLPPVELTALLHSRMQHLLERVQDEYGPYPPGEFWVPHRLGGGAPTLAEANRMDAEEAAEKAARRAAAGSRGSAGVARMEPVFRGLEIAVSTATRVIGSRITYLGLENIPAHGGAVVAINHTSYLDWYPSALAAYQVRRRLRFMIKSEMQQVKVVNFLIKHSGTIPVDREAGGGAAYAVAVERLREGELVAVYPEATISRSFELKEFKSGAARMARDAQVPIIPMIVWGTQRMWTKDHPRNMGRKKIPITVAIGPHVHAAATFDETNAAMREAMNKLLHMVQEDYPHPAGAYWVPHRLGGSAPTTDEAKALEEAELAERARRRAQRETKSRR